MKTYKLKDGRTVKAVKDKRLKLGCFECCFYDGVNCRIDMPNDLPACDVYDIHFKIVEGEK
jgi:hypothetical protein